MWLMAIFVFKSPVLLMSAFLTLRAFTDVFHSALSVLMQMPSLKNMFISCSFQNTSFTLFKMYSSPRLNKSRLKSGQILLALHNIGQSETSWAAGQWRSWYFLQLGLSVEELSTILQAIWSWCLNFAVWADVKNTV